MYAAFYGLEEEPFNITPDPRFLYLNNTYQEALAALTYGIQARKGFLSLIGEAGTGKTTLLRHLLDTLDPSVRTVLLMNPTVSFDEILEYILMELGIPTEATGKLARFHRLNEFLIEHARAGGNVALLIDEAQDLDAGVLEHRHRRSFEGPSGDHLLAFCRAGEVIAAVTRLSRRLEDAGGWRDTRLPLPDGRWRDLLTGDTAEGDVPAATLFARYPVALLRQA